MAERKMPHNIDAEMSVLGAMFLSKYAMQKACEELIPESFYLESHSRIFEVLKSLNDKNIPIDITTVTNELENKKLLSNIGGVEYLSEILNYTPSAANIEYYIQIVKEKALRRTLADKASQIATSCYEDDTDVNEILDDAEQKIYSVSKERKASEFKTISEVLNKFHSDLEQLSKNKSDITGLASGFSDLDKLTSGFHENELIIIAARPSVGKTAFALNVATNIARNTDKSVALFSLEMGPEQLVSRMISMVGGVEGKKLTTGKLEHQDWLKVGEAMSILGETNIFINDSSSITIGELRAQCRRLASSPKGLGIVIIDYLQLISGGSKYAGNRQQEVSDISRSLKAMAMELNVPVIALAQLSRSVEQRKEDKRPILSDLRESGSIEQDADIVAFLHRDDYQNVAPEMDTSNISEIELIIRKHRNGPIDTVNLIFQKNINKFVNQSLSSEN